MSEKRKLINELDWVGKRSKFSASPSTLSSHSDSDIDSINEAYALTFFNNLKQNLLAIPHDLTFVLSGGRKIHAHKILVLNSSVFFSNLAHLIEADKACIHLSNITDYESFEFCLSFVQNGRIGFINYDKIYDYCKMARLLKLHDLAEYLAGVIKKYELNASYNNFQAILSTFYSTISQTYLKINQEMDHLKKAVQQSDNFEFDTMNRDFVIKEKYMYSSDLVNEQSLESFIENFKYLSLRSCLEQRDEMGENFKRWCLIVFSFEKTSCNYVVKSKLTFTEANGLKTQIKELFENLLSHVADRKFNVQINRVCYLKKPTNCKTIKLENIKTSTDCFRAIVEYSKLNAHKELPFVLLTCHLSVNF